MYLSFQICVLSKMCPFERCVLFKVKPLQRFVLSKMYLSFQRCVLSKMSPFQGWVLSKMYHFEKCVIFKLNQFQTCVLSKIFSKTCPFQRIILSIHYFVLSSLYWFVVLNCPVLWNVYIWWWVRPKGDPTISFIITGNVEALTY